MIICRSCGRSHRLGPCPIDQYVSNFEMVNRAFPNYTPDEIHPLFLACIELLTPVQLAAAIENAKRRTQR